MLYRRHIPTGLGTMISECAKALYMKQARERQMRLMMQEEARKKAEEEAEKAKLTQGSPGSDVNASEQSAFQALTSSGAALPSGQSEEFFTRTSARKTSNRKSKNFKLPG